MSMLIFLKNTKAKLHITMWRLISGTNRNIIKICLKSLLMTFCMSFSHQLSSMPKEERIFSLLSTGILIILLDACTLVAFLVMHKAIYQKSVMKNIHSHNLIKEEQNQEQVETCMPYSQPASQLTVQGEILHSDCILRSKLQCNRTNLALHTQALAR